MKNELRDTLRAARKNNTLPAVTAYNRIDGSGSSLDLREFQQTFWSLPKIPKNPEADPVAAWTRQLPRTVGITINVGTRVEARPFNPGLIAARSYDFKWRVSRQPGLIPATRQNWLLKIMDLFGLSGVEFALRNTHPGLASSGLGGSPTATTAVCLLADELAHRPFGFPFDDAFTNGIQPTIRNISRASRWKNEPLDPIQKEPVAIRADLALRIGSVMCQRICRNIMQRISEEYSKECADFWYRMVWKCFEEKLPLYIVTCARLERTEDRNRKGGRTNIDMWDYKSVTGLSLILALQFPAVQVRMSKPIAKQVISGTEPAMRIRRAVDAFLLSRNVIIVGSPDVSDYGELLLAQIHGVAPYDKKPALQRLEKNGFYFVKQTADPDKNKETSSFFQKPKDKTVCEEVRFWGPSFGCIERAAGPAHFDGTAYSVLTLGSVRTKKPSCVERKLAIVSGFTGIATYGVVRLLANMLWEKDLENIEAGDDDLDSNALQAEVKKLSLSLRKLDRWAAVDVLFQVDYRRETLRGAESPGDHRSLTRVSLAEVREIKQGLLPSDKAPVKTL